MTNVSCSFVKKKITLYHTATCSLVISLLEKHGNFEVSPLLFTIITVEIELLLQSSLPQPAVAAVTVHWSSKLPCHAAGVGRAVSARLARRVVWRPGWSCDVINQARPGPAGPRSYHR